VNLSSLELRYLRYFVALAEELNFRRAAERLHVTTPALSVQIKKLEDILEVQLCKRDTARVRLTIAGAVLLREARELIAHIQNMLDTVQEAAQGHRGRLRIGIPGVFSHSFLLEALNDYQKCFPKVDVTLTDLAGNREQLEALEEGGIHIGFFCDFKPLHLRRMNHLLIIDTPLCAVLGKGHPLAAMEEVTLAQLAGYPLLHLAHYHTQTQHLVNVFHKARLNPKTFKKANTFHACVTMLAAGIGVALLPKMRAMAYGPQEHKLVLRPIKDPVAHCRLQVHAIWKKDMESPHVLNFIERFRKIGVQPD